VARGRAAARVDVRGRSSDKATRATRSHGAAVLAVAAAFLLAELGDKTMLATITLATREGWFGTWVGSTLGMVFADALAIGVGALLRCELRERVIRIGAEVAFLLFGPILIVEGIASR
jgi:Ca2+/H+ antiporter, TMEM165/GDT1 family